MYIYTHTHTHNCCWYYLLLLLFTSSTWQNYIHKCWFSHQRKPDRSHKEPSHKQTPKEKDNPNTTEERWVLLMRSEASAQTQQHHSGHEREWEREKGTEREGILRLSHIPFWRASFLLIPLPPPAPLSGLSLSLSLSNVTVTVSVGGLLSFSRLSNRLLIPCKSVIDSW